MTDDNRLESLAQALQQAWTEHRLVDVASWRDSLADANQAYRVQERLIDLLHACSGAVPAHWKCGGTDATGFTNAPLPDKGVRNSPADFSDMTIDPAGIEAEIALRLGDDVTPQTASGLSHESSRRFIDAMTVSIEVVSSRWSEGRKSPALLRLADLQSHGALVLGEWIPFTPRDWHAQRCEVQINTQAPQVFTGSLATGDPSSLLPAWLRHLTRHGATVPAGTVVTTGTWCGVLPIVSGDSVTVGFDDIGSIAMRL